MISWYSDSTSITPPPTRCRGRDVPAQTPRCRASCRREKLLCLAHALGQRLDLVVGVVHVKRGSRGGLQTERAMQWPGAVMVCTHCDAQLVEQLADVVRMHALHRERYGAAPVVGGQRAEDAHALDGAERLERVRGELLLVRGDVLHAERVEVVAGRGQPDRLRSRRN